MTGTGWMFMSLALREFQVRQRIVQEETDPEQDGP